MTRRLVLTADDYGVDPAVDRRILDLLDEGALTSATMIAATPRFAAAAEEWRRRRPDSPRLHACLTSPREGPRYRPVAEGGASLVDDDGAFPVSPGTAERHSRTDDLHREFSAQLARMAAAGFEVRGLDLHSGVLHGFHGRPRLSVPIGLCAREHLGLRLPRHPDPAIMGLPRGLADAVALGMRRQVRRAEAAGVSLPDAVANVPPGTVATYEELRDAVVRLLGRLPEGTSEFLFHPRHPWEARVLRDPRVRDACGDFELVGGWWAEAGGET